MTNRIKGETKATKLQGEVVLKKWIAFGMIQFCRVASGSEMVVVDNVKGVD